MFSMCVTAFSLYSRFPMPNVEYKERNMKYAMCFFPLVGAATGLFWYLWQLLLWDRFYGSLFLLCTGSMIPFLCTGGIHMDGFLDTCDAIHSYGDREKKLEILKDPHVGAFALLYGMIYFCLWIGVNSLIRKENLLLYVLVFVISRASSSVAYVVIPSAKKEGMQYTMGKAASKKIVAAACIIWLLFAFAAAFVLSVKKGVGMVLITIFLCALHIVRAKKKFGGMTGDLAGWYLQMEELLLFGAIGLM